MASIEYGPPGHKGVTTLMAVSDLPAPTERNVLIGAIGAWAAGNLLGLPFVRNFGAGATITLLVLRWAKPST